MATAGTKKVVALLGSRRKGNTLRLVTDLRTQLSALDVEVSIHNLYDYKVHDCTGCQRCIFGKSCGLRDERDVLMDEMRAADGIVLAAPIYMDHVPGRMKSFIDRTCKWFHRPELVGRPLMTLATTAGSGLSSTLDYMEKVGIRWGAFPTSRVGRTALNVQEPLSQKDYRAFVEHLWKPKHEYVPSLRQLMSFRVQHILAEVLFPVDEQFWREHGFLGQPYYFPCRINPLKRAVSASFHRYLRRKMHAARARRGGTALVDAPDSSIVTLSARSHNDNARDPARASREAR
jgi:multimeric flavodoxin WrbA